MEMLVIGLLLGIIAAGLFASFAFTGGTRVGRSTGTAAQDRTNAERASDLEARFHRELDIHEQSEQALREYARQLECTNQEVERQRAELTTQAVALQAAREEAERANGIKSQFLANLSHEIRTPMSAILGYVDLLIEDLAAGDQDKERWGQSLATIKTNGQHLMEIINDILDISKIE